MTQTLTKHGNSLVLVIDEQILKSLQIDEQTPLEVTMDGNKLVVQAQRTSVTDAQFEEAAQKVFTKHEKTFRKLAE